MVMLNKHHGKGLIRDPCIPVYRASYWLVQYFSRKTEKGGPISSNSHLVFETPIGRYTVYLGGQLRRKTVVEKAKVCANSCANKLGIKNKPRY